LILDSCDAIVRIYVQKTQQIATIKGSSYVMCLILLAQLRGHKIGQIARCCISYRRSKMYELEGMMITW
jgi:hypothetical protein